MHSGVARDLRLKEVNIVGKYTMSSNVRKNFNLAYRLPQDKKKNNKPSNCLLDSKMFSKFNGLIMITAMFL